MNNPGNYSLASLGITTALSSSTQTAITDLEGVGSVTLEAVFAYGSGGSTCNVVVQTTLDDGQTWRDVARFDFATSSAVKHANLSANSSKAVTSYSALSGEGVYDAVLGNSVRAVISSSGTYANTTISLKAAVR